MNKKQLSKLYDDLYNLANTLIEIHNPCEVSSKGCLDGHFCCTNCRHLGKKGCLAKSLTCKLWLCYSSSRKYPEVNRQLNHIHSIAEKYGFIVFRGSKKESMENAIRNMKYYKSYFKQL